MKQKFKTAMTILIGIALCQTAAGTSLAADKTSKFRVYQDNQLLMEFYDQAKAKAYAAQFSDSHVELIGSRQWIWDNYPNYRLYQYDSSMPNWEFATLDAAKKEAANWGHASIRDLHTGGWVWNNYPHYRLYQGEATLDNWEFATLNEAKAEAAKWSRAHIIDLNTNEWVWDNIGDNEKSALRDGPKVYRVVQQNYTQDDWTFAYLEDAVNEALQWSHSSIVNTQSGETVYRNSTPYAVYQNQTELASFAGLNDAIAEAQKWAHASIVSDGRAIWNNTPYFAVYQHEDKIGEFAAIPQALNYAQQYSNSSIRTPDGISIWDNYRKLQYWGWNGVSDAGKIKDQTAHVIGLDVDSPSWFVLADSSGKLTDNSNVQAVQTLKQQGVAIHPLVSNQFDGALSSAFLANPAARQNFVKALVDRSSALGVDGINIDFESLNANSRANFTAFIKELADYAHQYELSVSVDLPRGSAAWNAKTAFDHEQLSGIVDYIVTMAYDQYYQGSTSPGSVSGLSWAEEGIQEFLAYGIPRDKLILGIPFYVREWKLQDDGKLVGSRAVYMKDVPALVAAKKPVMAWDEQFQQYRGEYTDGGYHYVFWLEDQATVEQRIALAKEYDLAGV
ncbi:MAG: glycoside hydrolase family 18, partial [Paenibacillaceae bacterium]|nr:glycoside hydrolase family 18 [Paenibacillaceae bacterium]